MGRSPSPKTRPKLLVETLEDRRLLSSGGFASGWDDQARDMTDRDIMAPPVWGTMSSSGVSASSTQSTPTDESTSWSNPGASWDGWSSGFQPVKDQAPTPTGTQAYGSKAGDDPPSYTSGTPTGTASGTSGETQAWATPTAYTPQGNDSTPDRPTSGWTIESAASTGNDPAGAPTSASPAPSSPAPTSPAPSSPVSAAPAPSSPAPSLPVSASPAPISPVLVSPVPISPARTSPSPASPTPTDYGPRNSSVEASDWTPTRSTDEASSALTSPAVSAASIPPVGVAPHDETAAPAARVSPSLVPANHVETDTSVHTDGAETSAASESPASPAGDIPLDQEIVSRFSSPRMSSPWSPASGPSLIGSQAHTAPDPGLGKGVSESREPVEGPGVSIEGDGIGTGEAEPEPLAIASVGEGVERPDPQFADMILSLVPVDRSALEGMVERFLDPLEGFSPSIAGWNGPMGLLAASLTVAATVLAVDISLRIRRAREDGGEAEGDDDIIGFPGLPGLGKGATS